MVVSTRSDAAHREVASQRSFSGVVGTLNFTFAKQILHLLIIPLDLSKNKSRGDFMCHRTGSNENSKPLPVINGEKEKTETNNQWVTTGHKPLEDNRERRDGPGGD